LLGRPRLDRSDEPYAPIEPIHEMRELAPWPAGVYFTEAPLTAPGYRTGVAGSVRLVLVDRVGERRLSR
jgi:hypothetical protein